MRYAGFMTRLVAFILDLIVFVFVFAVIGFATKFTEEASGGFLAGYLTSRIGIFATLVYWLYYAVMESSHYQGTAGKIMMNIKVTDMDGARIDFIKATVRFFSKYISSFLIMAGYLMALFTQKRQALHDIIAGCLVVHRTLKNPVD
jgi:uncharacterized RDD family membrane protein YckC